MPEQKLKNKKIDCYLLSNFIFIGIEAILFMPFISIYMLNQSFFYMLNEGYIGHAVEWNFNYYIMTFIISIVNSLIILIYSIVILR